MSSSAERAAALRAEAEALDALAVLELDLLAAKSAHAEDASGETKTAKQAASEALRAARSLTRADGVSVGGDAFIETEA